MRVALIISLLFSIPAFGQQASFHHSLSTTSSCTYDADLCAYKTRLAAVGVTMHDSDAAKFQTFIDTAKFYGFYDSLKAVWFAYGGTSASNALDYKNTYDLTFVNSPTHSANGVDWNGTTQYATTTFLPTSLTINSASLSYYSRDNSGSSGAPEIPIGTFNGTALLFQLNLTSANAVVGGTTAALASYTASRMDGYFIANRSASNDLKVYRNGTQIASSPTTITEMPATAISLGRRGDGCCYATQQMAYADISGALTGLQVTKKTEAVNRLQTALYRNVY